MKIRRIRLQNIKSYADQEIVFHDGVNFISGINGAGKSTIIEAIGYALFDYSPGNIGELVRYGARSGTITVEFCANDDREYRIVRKINASTSSSAWTVYDLESGGEVDLHGVRDVRAWVKEVLGIERDMDPDQLFQNIIGVPQGTFVAPFLESPAVRKKKFDSILRVEQYREAYNNTKAAAGLLKERIDGMRHTIDIMAERVRDYDHVKGEISSLEGQISDLTGKLENLGLAIQDKEREVKAAEDTKARLDEAENTVKILQVRGTTLEEKAAELNKSLQKACTAAENVRQAEDGYRKYLQLKQELEQLEARRQEKEALEKELHRARQEIARLEAETAARTDSLARTKAELEAGRKTLHARLQELDRAREQAARELAATRATMSKLEQWKQAEDELSRLNRQLDRIIREIDGKEELLAGVGKEENELGERLGKLAGLRETAAQYDSREKKLLEARKQYEVLRENLNNLTENLARTQGGLCPFLKTPCLNVQGDLESYFTARIAETKRQIKESEEQGKQLRLLFEEAKAAREEVIALTGDESRLDRLRTEKKKLSAEIRQLLDTASALPVAEVLQNLTTVSGINYHRAKEAVAVFRDILTRPAVPGTARGMADTAAACLETVLDESSGQRTGREKQLLRELDEGSAKVSRLDTEYNNTLQNLEQLGEKEDWARHEAALIAEMTARTNNLKQDAGETARSLADYGALDEEIRRVKSVQEACREDYEAYIRNRPDADRIDAVKAELAGVEAEITANMNRLSALQAEITVLKSAFDPQRYEQARLELDQLKQADARERQVLVERRRDLQELETKLQEMDQVLEKIEVIRQELAAGGKTLALLETVRNILNSAGPPVARVYLENLSLEANNLYRQISRENVSLEWREGYEIFLVDNFNGKKRERTFKQFSGGEQMTAALAVRLALLKQQSGVRVGFFDEPTANLDSERRVNLAETIPQVTGGFSQIFIISHDDTFDAMTDNIIHLQKDSGNGSQVTG